MKMPFPLSGGSYRFDHDAKRLVREDQAPVTTTDRTTPAASTPVSATTTPSPDRDHSFRRRKASDTTED